MPWLNPIDPTIPQDTHSAAEGAERIRELKRGLIERLSTFFRGFPDDHPEFEGQQLLYPATSVLIGTLAQRPESPDRPGQGYFATDTGELFFGTLAETWRLFTVPVPPPVLEFPVLELEETVNRSGVIGGSTGFVENWTFPADYTPDVYLIVAGYVRFRDNNNPYRGMSNRWWMGRQNFGGGGHFVEFEDGSGGVSGFPFVQSVEARSRFVSGIERFAMRMQFNLGTPQSFDYDITAKLQLAQIGEIEEDEYEYDYDYGYYGYP